MKNVFGVFTNLFSAPGAHLRNGELTKPRLAYSLQSGLSPEFIEKYGLTSRETEVTEVLLQGKSDREIAALLEIALNTVQAHLKHIYKKTSTKGRYALMVLAGLGKEE